jgi:hypothetical protein
VLVTRNADGGGDGGWSNRRAYALIALFDCRLAGHLRHVVRGDSRRNGTTGAARDRGAAFPGRSSRSRRGTRRYTHWCRDSGRRELSRVNFVAQIEELFHTREYRITGPGGSARV